MTLTLEQLRTKVASQKTALPALYGDVDFVIKPERFADELVSEGPPAEQIRHMRAELLADADKGGAHARLHHARRYRCRCLCGADADLWLPPLVNMLSMPAITA